MEKELGKRGCRQLPDPGRPRRASWRANGSRDIATSFRKDRRGGGTLLWERKTAGKTNLWVPEKETPLQERVFPD